MSARAAFTSDVIVVGSGPGGATVARELSRAGKKVTIFERGHDHRGRFYYGTYPGALLYSDKMSFLFTEEGLNIISPIMVGGATSMFCGCAAPPPRWPNRCSIPAIRGTPSERWSRRLSAATP